MKLLEEFAEELGAEEEEISATEVPEEEIDGLTEEEKLMLGELEETEEAKIFEELDKVEEELPKDDEEIADNAEEDEELIVDINEKEDEELIDDEGELGLDVIGGLEEDYDLLKPKDRPKEAKKEAPDKVYETLAEKQQRERNLMEELQAVKEKELDALIEEKTKDKKLRYSSRQVLALKVQLKDIIQSPVELANIRKGTKIISLKNDKVYRVKRDITVKAHTLPDADNYRYFQNKKGEVTHKVIFNKIANIRRVTELYQKPHYFSRIKKVKKVSLLDKKLDYSLNFNLHGGLTFNQYTNQIVGGTENYAAMLRTELGVLTKLNYPIHIGGSLVYESIKGNIKRGGTFSTKILSFGPTLVKDNIYEEYKLIFQPRISIFADLTEQASDNTEIHRLSDTSVLLGLEKNTKYKMFGKLTVGFNIQRKWIKPKAQNSGFDIGPDIRYDDSMALYVGHSSDWLW